MTRDELRRKALLAANRVVLALTAGCLPQGLGVVLAPPCPATADTGTMADTDVEYADVVDTDVAPIESDEPVCSGLVGEEVWRCCEERAIWCDENVADAADECLFGPGFNGETGCIPWGPPVPPRLGAFAGGRCGALA